MKLLFKRSQSKSTFGKPIFKLWAQIEFENDEEALVGHYRFASSKLIEAIQPGLIRRSALVGAIAFALCMIVFSGAGYQLASFLGLLAGSGAGWFYYDRMRETIYVKDLIHGRYFACPSIIELARKEAWLGVVSSFLRQVMESAKYWDGAEVVPVDALSKAEAKFVVIRGL